MDSLSFNLATYAGDLYKNTIIQSEGDDQYSLHVSLFEDSAFDEWREAYYLMDQEERTEDEFLWAGNYSSYTLALHCNVAKISYEVPDEDDGSSNPDGNQSQNDSGSGSSGTNDSSSGSSGDSSSDSSGDSSSGSSGDSSSGSSGDNSSGSSGTNDSSSGSSGDSSSGSSGDSSSGSSGDSSSGSSGDSSSQPDNSQATSKRVEYNRQDGEMIVDHACCIVDNMTKEGHCAQFKKTHNAEHYYIETYYFKRATDFNAVLVDGLDTPAKTTDDESRNVYGFDRFQLHDPQSSYTSGDDYAEFTAVKAQPRPLTESLGSLDDNRYGKGDTVMGYIYDPTREGAEKWRLEDLAQLTNGAFNSLTSAGVVAAVAVLATAVSF